MVLDLPTVISLLLGLTVAVVPLVAAVDAGRLDRESWYAAQHSKVNWVLLLLGSSFCCAAGIIPAAIYFVSIRPEVAAHQRDPNRPTLTPT